MNAPVEADACDLVLLPANITINGCRVIAWLGKAMNWPLLTSINHCDQGSLLSHRNPAIRSIDEVHSLHIKSRRVWVGIIDPASPHRKLDEEASETFQVWLPLLVSTPFSLSMCAPVQIPVQATADAMASTNPAGLGGAVFFPDESSTSTWFQFRITLEEAQALWPWIGDDMQKHIAAWELLAQF